MAIKNSRIDLTAVLIALIAGLCSAAPATILAWRTNIKVEEVAEKVEIVHKATNSLTEKLVQSTASENLQKGRAEGKEEQREIEAEKSRRR